MRLRSNTNSGGHEFLYLIIPLVLLLVLFAFVVPLTSFQTNPADFGSALCEQSDTSAQVSKYHFLVPSQHRQYDKVAHQSDDTASSGDENAPDCRPQRYELFL